MREKGIKKNEKKNDYTGELSVIGDRNSITDAAATGFDFFDRPNRAHFPVPHSCENKRIWATDLRVPSSTFRRQPRTPDVLTIYLRAARAQR